MKSCSALISVIIATLIASLSVHAGWEIECIDCTPWLENWFPHGCLWVGEGGQTILVTGGDGLYVYRNEGAGWTLETVSRDLAREISLAVETPDHFWISYVHGEAGQVRLAEFRTGSWRFEPFPEATAPGRGAERMTRFTLRSSGRWPGTSPTQDTLAEPPRAGPWRQWSRIPTPERIPLWH
jgi:hypothetical protein